MFPSCLAVVSSRRGSNEGALAFYKGLTPNLIRCVCCDGHAAPSHIALSVVPASCITFLVYENVWRLFH